MTLATPHALLRSGGRSPGGRGPGLVPGSVLGLVLGLAGCGQRAGTPGGGASSGTPPADPAALGTPWFREAAAERGLTFTHRSGHREEYWMPEIMGGGVALFDLEGDGDLDVYFVQSGSLARGAEQPPNRLFANDGGGRFRDVTAGSGAEDPRYGNGVACGDVDGDGDTDLYVTNVGRNTLLLNEGGGRFRDATLEAGVGSDAWGTSAAFFDADLDGDLDLFVTNYLEWSVESELDCSGPLGRPDYCSPKNYLTPTRDLFYRNQGDGTFRDESEASGVASERGTGLGVLVADFDGDGFPDVFVANDGMEDRLWRGLGDGAFEEVASQWGCATDLNGLKKAGMGVAAADVDGDLDEDLLVCNLAGESDSMYRNEGSYFADRTSPSGLASATKTYTRFGLGWVDFDNDGDHDLFQANGRVARTRAATAAADPYAEANLLLEGDGRGRFHEVLPRGGTAPVLVATSRAAAFGDLDGDGAPDVVVVNRDGPAHLLLNAHPARGGSVHLRVLERGGRAALGATVYAEVGGRTLRRDVRAAYSYQASSDSGVHLGLGDAPRADALRVRWADGAEERFGPCDAGERVVLQRGEGSG